MGYIADLLGRRLAMITTLSLTVFGALFSAILPWGSTSTVYAIISACRFILGVGVGGIYPCAAIKAAESSSYGENASNRVG